MYFIVSSFGGSIVSPQTNGEDGRGHPPDIGRYRRPDSLICRVARSLASWTSSGFAPASSEARISWRWAAFRLSSRATFALLMPKYALTTADTALNAAPAMATMFWPLLLTTFLGTEPGRAKKATRTITTTAARPTHATMTARGSRWSGGGVLGSFGGDGKPARDSSGRAPRLSTAGARDTQALGEGRVEHAGGVEPALNREPVRPARIQRRHAIGGERVELPPVGAHLEVGQALLV